MMKVLGAGAQMRGGRGKLGLAAEWKGEGENMMHDCNIKYVLGQNRSFTLNWVKTGPE